MIGRKDVENERAMKARRKVLEDQKLDQYWMNKRTESELVNQILALGRGVEVRAIRQSWRYMPSNVEE